MRDREIIFRRPPKALGGPLLPRTHRFSPRLLFPRSLYGRQMRSSEAHVRGPRVLLNLRTWDAQGGAVQTERAGSSRLTKPSRSRVSIASSSFHLNSLSPHRSVSPFFLFSLSIGDVRLEDQRRLRDWLLLFLQLTVALLKTSRVHFFIYQKNNGTVSVVSSNFPRFFKSVFLFSMLVIICYFLHTVLSSHENSQKKSQKKIQRYFNEVFRDFLDVFRKIFLPEVRNGRAAVVAMLTVVYTHRTKVIINEVPASSKTTKFGFILQYCFVDELIDEKK